MQEIIASIRDLYRSWKGEDPLDVDVLPQSGSERRYFRLHGAGTSVIGTYGANIRENETFHYFTQHFKERKLAVPQILAFSDDKQFICRRTSGMSPC